MTDTQIGRAVQLRQQGWTWQEISDRVGMERSWVARVVRQRLGPTIPELHRRVREAVQLRAAGWSYRRIADHLGYADEFSAKQSVCKHRQRQREAAARPPAPKRCPTCGQVRVEQAS